MEEQYSIEKLRRIFESISEVVFHYTLSPEFKLDYISPSVLELTGYTQQEFYEDNFLAYKLVHPDDGAMKESSLKAIHSNVIDPQKVVTTPVQFRCVKKDGTIIWAETINKVLFDEHGKGVSVEGISRDITATKKLEEEKYRSSENYKSLLEQLPCGVVIYNHSGILFANSVAMEMVGLGNSAFPISNLSIFDFIVEEYHDVIRYRVQKMMAGETPQPLEFKIKRKDGSLIDAETKSTLVEYRGEKAIQAIFNDISARKQAERSWLESEKKFNSLSRSSPVGIFITDHKGWPIYVNKKMAEITGLSSREILENKWQHIVAEEDRKKVDSLVKDGEYATKDFVADIRILNAVSGNKCWVRIKTSPIKDENEEITGWTGSLEDITERKNLENEKDLAGRKRDLHFDQTPLIIIEWDLNFNVVRWNPAAEKTFGYSRGEILGKSGYSLAHADHVPLVEKMWKELIATQKRVTLTNKNITKKGRILYCQWHNTPLVNNEGELMGVTSMAMDITEQFNTQNALKESERALSTLMNNLPGMAYRCKNDRKWTMEFVSKGCKELTGYDSEEFINNNKLSYSDTTSEEEKDSDWNTIQKALKERRPFSIGYRIKTKTGDTKWVWEQGEGLYNESGKVVAIEGFIADITEIKTAEEKIKRSEEKFKSLVEYSPDGIFISQDGAVIYVNKSGLSIMGVASFEELRKDNIFDFLMPEYRAASMERVKRAMQGEKLDFIVVKAQRPNGEIIDAEIKSLMINYEGKPALQTIVHDLGAQKKLMHETLRAELAEEMNELLEQEITKRKLAQIRHLESEKFLKNIINGSLDIICAADEAGEITEFNLTSQKTFGYSRDEVLGRSVSILYASPTEFKERTKQLEKTGQFIGEAHLKRKDGSVFLSYISLSTLYNHAGEYIGNVGIARDITEQKEKERQILDQSAKLKAIFESSPHHIWTVNREHVVTSFNTNYANSFRDIYGVRPVENKTGLKTLKRQKDEGSGLISYYKAAFKGMPQQFELTGITRKGEFFAREVFLQPIISENGEVKEVSGIGHNITERKRIQEQVAIQAAKLKTIFETSSHLVFTINPAFELTSFNGQFEEFSKEIYDFVPRIGTLVNAGKMISTKEFNDQWMIFFKKAFKGRSQQFETVFRSKNGEEVWKEVYLNPIYGNGKEVVEVSGIAHDITENKRAEHEIMQSLKEKEILIKEVHHRVKNNLQVISSILSLQSSYTRNKVVLDLLKEIQNRVKSMAFIHESLYQSKDISKINFSEYVSTLSQNLLHSYTTNDLRIGLKVSVPNLFLSLDQSIPCGLIINELLSNALKYAFTGRKKGEVTVQVKEEKQKITIIISDNGIGLPTNIDFRNTESLGLQLVTALAEQINGKISMSRKGGTKYTVSFLKNSK
jgi:PAS domain S-box-containing protein